MSERGQPADPRAGEEKPIPWLELVETLFRRRRIVIGCVVAGLALSAAVVWATPPRYKARARILLTAQAVSGPREAAMSEKQVQAELALLSSPALIRAVLANYARTEPGPQPAASLFSRLWTRATLFASRLRARFRSEPERDPIDEQVEAVAAQIKTGAVEGSNVVEVAYNSDDPEWAARFVNDLIDQHIERVAKLSEQSGARSFYKRQLDLLAARWKETGQALAAYRERQGAGLLEEDAGQFRRVLGELQSSRVAAETQVLELKARVEFLTRELKEHPETISSESRFTENESVKYLKSRILELEIKRSELLSRYTPESTPVRELDRQISEATRLLENKSEDTLSETKTEVNPAHQTLEVDLVQSQAQLTAAQAKVDALAAQVAEYRGKLSQVEANTAELDRLQTEVENAKQNYQSYQRKEEEARFSNALDESRIVNVATVDRADVPSSPEPSSSTLVLLLGLGCGLLVGTVLAFVKDWLDPTVKSGAQASRVAGVPVIIRIPAN